MRATVHYQTWGHNGITPVVALWHLASPLSLPSPTPHVGPLVPTGHNRADVTRGLGQTCRTGHTKVDGLSKERRDLPDTTALMRMQAEHLFSTRWHAGPQRNPTTPVMGRPRGLQRESKEAERWAISSGVRDLDPNRCHHATSVIVPLAQLLAWGKPRLQPNRGYELLYTTRHGDTMASHQWWHCGT